ncbi:MAG: VanZ family protein [Gemmatimonadaceae bacterium]|nr:VanZ family protein [Gemmatimonadaceae bacterium]
MATSESPILPRTPVRRAADVTAARLGRAILGYLVAITCIITLAPFRFASAPVHGLTDLWDWKDAVMNVVMFVPLGFVYQLTRPVGAPLNQQRVLLLGALLSGFIETVQLFAPSRYTSLVDLATNAVGAVVGAWLYHTIVQRLEGDSTVRSLALELPLMGLVYLLVPLLWLTGLASDGGSRAWLMLPVLAFGGGILGTVYAAYLEPNAGRSPWWLFLSASTWYGVAFLPGTFRQTAVVVAGGAVVFGTAWLRSIATRRYRQGAAIQRFELPTLRLVLPLFAAYLALSSLWPLQLTDGRSVWMTPLLTQSTASKTDVFVALEHVAAFTLVGYIIAEFHGRDLLRYRAIAGRVALWSGGLSLLLEAARSVHPLYRASLSMYLLTMGAALFGGWMYQLQRDHVRALLQRRTARVAVSACTPAQGTLHASQRHVA